MPRKSSGNSIGSTDSRGLLCEISWEVCNQVGGIYTVLRSKAPAMVERWGERYLLIGPYEPEVAAIEFEEQRPTGYVAETIEGLAVQGIKARYGQWLITGQPQVVLIDRRSVTDRMAQIKYLLWEHHDISTPAGNQLLDDVAAFGHAVEWFLRLLTEARGLPGPVIAHFHEWMAAAAIPELRRARLPAAIVFTTHATSLGRFLTMANVDIYEHPPSDWIGSARWLGIEPQVRIERAAAHGAHVFTTVSEVTAYECEKFIGRRPEVLLPNGLNIERFVALHEFQNLHRLYKEKIARFVIGHFFPAYRFDLDSTLFFFSSGRFEYRNKGFDLTMDALARLNARLIEERSTATVVFFLLTKRPYHSVNSETLQTQAQMAEIFSTCQSAGQQLADRLFLATVQGETPSLDDLLDEMWRMRLRRLRQAWRVRRLPAVVTHDLTDDSSDEVLVHLRRLGLVNRAEDRVKIVYHPEFLSGATPLPGIDYDQFVRGCHLGIFPSLYEPWGYTPEECAARGIPAVTSDLSGFGSYLAANIPDHDDRGLYVLRRRRRGYWQSVDDLAECLWRFAGLNRRSRIDLRNRVEDTASHFDWSTLVGHYDEAYRLALSSREAEGAA